MTDHPTYLDALARAADWERPPDERTDAARPRPRSRFEPDGPDARFEPDGPDTAEGEAAWFQTSVETEATGPVGPTPSRTQRAVPPQPTEDEPPIGRPEPLTASAELAAPQRMATQPAGEEAFAPETARPAVNVEPASPGGLPAPPAHPVREPEPAEPVKTSPEPSTAAKQRAPVPTVGAAAPVAQPEAAPPREPAAAPDAAHEARPVARLVEVAATEEPAPRGPEADDGPTVVVEIGRIEVRLASDPGAAPQPTVIRPTPGPSLADYLRDRSVGGGRPA